VANSPLFPAKSEESNFNYWLKSTIESLSEEECMAGGYNFQRLSAHSTRKGGTSYAAALPGLCNIIALWLRAGWSLGSVLPSYAHANDGGDQNVGRILCGLDPNSSNLSLLPCRFKHEDVQAIPWADILVNFANYPTDFKIVVPYLVASVIYHKEFIIEHLPRDNKLFLSRFWINGWPTKLETKVLPPVKMRCEQTDMVATGVGPVTLLQNEFHEMKEEVCLMVRATIPVSKGDLGELRNEMQKDINEAINQLLIKLCNNNNGGNIGSLDHQPQLLQQSSTTITTTTVVRYDTWNWGNLFGHPVPENYEFPAKNTSLRNIHDLWHFGCVHYEGEKGEVVKLIRPFKLIDAKHFSGSKNV